MDIINSKSFCVMPWIGLATDASGGIRPCCWMDAVTQNKFFGDPNYYRNSTYLEKIKEKFLNNEYPDACHRCKHDDENGMQSKRVRENNTWKNINKDIGNLFSVIDLRLSNTCNLGCIMCGPKSSSYIKTETEKNLQITPDHYRSQFQIVKNLNLLDPYTDEQIDQIINVMRLDSRIYFTGGEPSLVKKSIRLLEKLIEKGYNKTVSLEFNSNFQTLNNNWIKLLKQFKGSMMPSLDGINELAEYVRYPCEWKKIDLNVKNFIVECGETWQIKCMPTVSIVSIFGLKDLYQWWYNDIMNEFPIIKNRIASGAKMRVQLNNRLNSPKYFDIRNLPISAKHQAIQDINYIINNYEKYFQGKEEKKFLSDIITHINLEPNEDFTKTINTLNKFDSIRNTNWKKSLHRLAKYTNE